MKKLEASNMVHAAFKAIQLGILEPDILKLS